MPKPIEPARIDTIIEGSRIVDLEAFAAAVIKAHYLSQDTQSFADKAAEAVNTFMINTTGSIA